VKKFAAILLVLLAIALTGSKLYSNKQMIEKRSNLKGDVDSFPVYAEEAEFRPYTESIIFDGVLKADGEISIYSEKMGVVVKKYKKAGDYLLKGDLIALVDNSLEQELQRIYALNLETAAKELERAKKLFDSSAISLAKYESALVAYRQAQTAAADIKKQVEISYIRSPLSGVIDSDYFEEGSLLSVGSHVADIVSVTGLKMTAKVSEEEVIKLKLGDMAEMYAEVLPELKFIGKISRISTNANRSFNYIVEITVDNPAALYKKGVIKPGMYARANVKTYETKLLMVPKSALITDSRESKIFLLEGEKAFLRSVDTGKRDDLFVEITGGLKPGEMVVTSGHINLKDGTSAYRVTAE
jgi:RND family efflux transporter MFP subunit